MFSNDSVEEMRVEISHVVYLRWGRNRLTLAQGTEKVPIRIFLRKKNGAELEERE